MRELSKIKACLLGGAIGDALGAPLEFMRLSEIRRKFGEEGLTDYVPCYGKIGAITDDTQMMLFTLEGLLRARLCQVQNGHCDLTAITHNAYQRWYLTQGGILRSDTEARLSGWLFEQSLLHSRRAPGNSCLSALRDHSGPATYKEPVNDSKGCGGIMRIAPVGLFAEDPFQTGVELAALTHGHPSGYLAAGFFAQVVSDVKDDVSLRESIERAKVTLQKWDGHAECKKAVERAVAFADKYDPTPETLESLGGGWVAEEALAIGLYCALVAVDYQDGVLLAINHTGDSDSTGMLAGNLLGLMYGLESIPAKWIEKLEVRGIIEEMARDAVEIFDLRLRSELMQEWNDKYPVN